MPIQPNTFGLVGESAKNQWLFLDMAWGNDACSASHTQSLKSA